MLAPRDVYHGVPLHQRGIRRTLCNNGGAAFFACWVKNEIIYSLFGVCLSLKSFAVWFHTRLLCLPCSLSPWDCCSLLWGFLRQEAFMLPLFNPKIGLLKEKWEDGFLDHLKGPHSSYAYSCSTPCTGGVCHKWNPVTPVGKSWKHCITSWHFHLSPFLSFISRTSALLDYLCSIDENSLQSSLQTVRGFSVSSFWDQSCILTYLTGWELLLTEV